MTESRLGYYARSMCGLKVDQLVLQDIFAFNGENASERTHSLGPTCSLV
jgi:hypothetical protein